jgi:predicted RNA-binding protein YlqC (UPF0109 family)
MATHREIALWLQMTICCLVDTPDQVSVEEVDQGDTVLFRVRVAPREMGQVIGKSGRLARSIRIILMGATMRSDRRYTLDVSDMSASSA